MDSHFGIMLVCLLVLANGLTINGKGITNRRDVETFEEAPEVVAETWEECSQMCRDMTECTHWVWRSDDWSKLQDHVGTKNACYRKVSSGKLTGHEEGLVIGDRNRGEDESNMMNETQGPDDFQQRMSNRSTRTGAILNYVSHIDGPGCGKLSITTSSECGTAASSLGFSQTVQSGNWNTAPPGCMVGYPSDWKKTFFNTHATGTTGKNKYKSLCHKDGFKNGACYEDCIDGRHIMVNCGRILEGFLQTYSQITVEKCKAICKDKGFAFAGLEQGSWCGCGNEVPAGHEKPGECNMACNGDSGQICGDTSRINIYRTGLTLYATCDNDMKIFADTKLLIADNDWKKTSDVGIPENTNSVEIHCYDHGSVGGILASFDNGLKTDGTWSCSADGGSTWNPAYNTGPHGVSPWGFRPHISWGAKWIWTGKDTYHGKHKNVICKISLGAILNYVSHIDGPGCGKLSITTSSECGTAASSLGFSQTVQSGNWDTAPPGCMVGYPSDWKKTFFNTHATGTTGKNKYKSLCHKGAILDYVSHIDGPGCGKLSITTSSECGTAASSLGFSQTVQSGNWNTAPPGCMVGYPSDWKRTFFNTHATGTTGKNKYKSLCHKGAILDYVSHIDGPGCGKLSITTSSECGTAASSLGFSQTVQSGNWNTAPPGCMVGYPSDWKKTFFNTHATGTTGKNNYKSLCHKALDYVPDIYGRGCGQLSITTSSECGTAASSLGFSQTVQSGNWNTAPPGCMVGYPSDWKKTFFNTHATGTTGKNKYISLCRKG